jgi:hypothetical protein
LSFVIEFETFLVGGVGSDLWLKYGWFCAVVWDVGLIKTFDFYWVFSGTTPAREVQALSIAFSCQVEVEVPLVDTWDGDSSLIWRGWKFWSSPPYTDSTVTGPHYWVMIWVPASYLTSLTPSWYWCLGASLHPCKGGSLGSPQCLFWHGWKWITVILSGVWLE